MPTINDSRCVLVIGATSGIGRALALAIHNLPSEPTVIVAGRRQERLDELVEIGKKKGGRLDGIRVDVTADAGQLKKFVQDVTEKYPQLDTVIFSSGIQHPVDFSNPTQVPLDQISQEFTTNYVSIVTLITYFLPHLMSISSQGRPTLLIPITSFLGIISMPQVPNYCATKAAVHSLCITLRLQLKDTGVHIIELIPPLVESELHRHQRNAAMLSKFWVPIDEFTQEAMEGLKRGDPVIVPRHEELYDTFEKGRVEFIAERAEQLRIARSRLGGEVA